MFQLLPAQYVCEGVCFFRISRLAAQNDDTKGEAKLHRSRIRRMKTATTPAITWREPWETSGA